MELFRRWRRLKISCWVRDSVIDKVIACCLQLVPSEFQLQAPRGVCVGYMGGNGIQIKISDRLRTLVRPLGVCMFVCTKRGMAPQSAKYVAG